MAYWLFIVVNALLFVRLGEIAPGLEGAPIYQVAIILCLIAAIPQLLDRLSAKNLFAQPMTVCVLGLWVTTVFSHLARQNFSDAQNVAIIFGKVVVYFLLLISLVDSPLRLRHLLLWLSGMITASAGLAVLQFHEFIDLPGLRIHVENQLDPETGESKRIDRLCGPGIFSDPNDLCIALTFSIVVSLYAISSIRGALRFLWLAPLLLSGYAVLLTQSRGGLLGLLTALLALAAARYGWRKALLLGMIAIPAILVASGRQVNFDLSDPNDTGQGRIQLWAEGLSLFMRSPIFGIGEGLYAEEVGLVAHNSFIHAYTELGFLGGTFFLGAFVYSIRTLYAIHQNSPSRVPRELQTLGPVAISLIAGTVAALMSLSRVYTYPAYIVLGICAVYLHLTWQSYPTLVRGMSSRLMVRFVGLGLIFIPSAHVLVNVLVRWN